MHYKIDSDKHPRIKYYYDARIEPFFQLLLQGTNIKRITGYNFDYIRQQATFVKDAHNSFDYIGDDKGQWVEWIEELKYQERIVSYTLHLLFIIINNDSDETVFDRMPDFYRDLVDHV